MNHPCSACRYIEIKGAKEAWAQSSVSGGMLLFDTTHGTTRYGLKARRLCTAAFRPSRAVPRICPVLQLGLFATVDGDGKTRLLGIFLCARENHESFTWAFNRFQTFCGVPVSVMSDEDPAMATDMTRAGAIAPADQL